MLHATAALVLYVAIGCQHWQQYGRAMEHDNYHMESDVNRKPIKCETYDWDEYILFY